MIGQMISVSIHNRQLARFPLLGGHSDRSLIGAFGKLYGTVKVHVCSRHSQVFNRFHPFSDRAVVEAKVERNAERQQGLETMHHLRTIVAFCGLAAAWAGTAGAQNGKVDGSPRIAFEEVWDAENADHSSITRAEEEAREDALRAAQERRRRAIEKAWAIRIWTEQARPTLSSNPFMRSRYPTRNILYVPVNVPVPGYYGNDRR